MTGKCKFLHSSQSTTPAPALRHDKASRGGCTIRARARAARTSRRVSKPLFPSESGAASSSSSSSIVKRTNEAAQRGRRRQSSFKLAGDARAYALLRTALRGAAVARGSVLASWNPFNLKVSSWVWVGTPAAPLYTPARCSATVSGHTTQSAPALIRTPKLSCVGLG